MRCAHERGHEATSVRDRGWLERSDHELVKLALENDLVIVTRNFVDFRRLLRRADVQPGIVSLQVSYGDFSASTQASLFRAALDEAEARGDLMNLDVEAIADANGVIVVSVYDLPPP